MDTDDRDDILLSESDDAPGGAPAPTGAEPPRRGRGRPKGTTQKRPSGERSERLAGVNEMADVLCKLIGVTSSLLAFAIVGSDYAKEVALTQKEAIDIALPAARMLRKSRMARQLSALATRGGDTVSLVSALAGYLMRVGPIVAGIQAQKAGQQSGHFGVGQVIRPQQPQQPGQPASAGNGHGGGLGGAGFSDPDANAANAFAGWDSPDVAAAFAAAASY